MRWTQEQYEAYQRKRAGAGLGGVENTKRQPDKRSEGKDRIMESGQDRVGYRVGVISVRKRKIDEHDNLRTGAKPLVDAITVSLGFSSDDDARLIWEYGQVIGEPEGTIVRIQRIHP